MGGSGVLFAVGTGCGCPTFNEWSSSQLCTHYQPQHYQPALCLFGQHKRCIGLAGNRPGSGKRLRRTVANAVSEGNPPSSNLVLTEHESASVEETGAPHLEVAHPDEGDPHQEHGAEWLTARSLHQEFSTFIAARKKEGDSVPEPLQDHFLGSRGTQESAALSSLQNRKELGTKNGLLGFQEVGQDVASSGRLGEAQRARVSMGTASDGPGNNAPGDAASVAEPPSTTKGGTKIIRCKGKGDTQRFEAFLGQRAAAVELPPSDPIPLSAMGFSPPPAPKEEARRQTRRRGPPDKPARKLKAKPVLTQQVRGPVSGKGQDGLVAAAESASAEGTSNPREELTRKVTSFASRLMRAVSASDSHREVWPRFVEPTLAQPAGSEQLSDASLDSNMRNPVTVLKAGPRSDLGEAGGATASADAPDVSPVIEGTTETSTIPVSMGGVLEAQESEARPPVLTPVQEVVGADDSDARMDDKTASLGEEMAVTSQPAAGNAQPMANAAQVKEPEKEPLVSSEPSDANALPAAVTLQEPDAAVETESPSPFPTEVEVRPVVPAGTLTGFDLEDRIPDETTAEMAEVPEPSFPHWLAGPGSRVALLADAEASAAETWEGANVQVETGGRNGEVGNGSVAASNGVDPSQDSSVVPLVGSRENGAAPHGANGFVNLRLAQSQSALETNSSTGPDTLCAEHLGSPSNGTLGPDATPPTLSRTPLPSSEPQLKSGLAADRSDSSGSGNGGVRATGTKRQRRKRKAGFVDFVFKGNWEEPEAKPEVPPQLVLNYPKRSTTAEIVDGDRRVLASALAYGRWWVRSWRVPLQSDYDPDFISDYFGRRPHLVCGRLLQLAAAAVEVGVPSVIHLARARDAPDGSERADGLEKRKAVRRAAQRLKAALVGLGPTFIKVAQSLSARPDVVGEETAAVLSELQDRLPPFSSAAAMAVIERELGRPVGDVFLELSNAPVAAASFGQVYKGRTRTGEAVAVKVQRPGVLSSVALDIHILRSLLQGVRKVARINSDLRLLADELGRGLYGELDYMAEAANAELFALSQRHLPFVAVPRVLHEYTSRRVLTMEWIEGDRPVDLLAAADAGNQSAGASEARTKLLSLVSMGIESSLVQLLETGVMHSDPHPGNLLLQADGKLVYLDFGLMTRITPQHRAGMMAAIAHLVNAEWAALTEDLDALDVLKPSNDRAEVAAALAAAFGGGAEPLITGTGVPRVRFGQVASKLWAVALRFRFKLPPYFTLVLRNLASLEGISLTVDPSFKVFASAYPHVVRRILSENTPAARRVLRTLLTDGRGGLRWDRIAALARGGLSVGTGAPKQAASLVLAGSPQGLSSRAADVILGSCGAGVRRVLLGLDLVRFAADFSSSLAAPIRTLLAAAAADAIDRALFGPVTERPLSQDSPHSKALQSPLPTVSPTPSMTVESISSSVPSSPVPSSFVVHSPSKRHGEHLDFSETERRVVRKRAWLLLKLMAAKSPRGLAARTRLVGTALLFALAVFRGLVARAWKRLMAAMGLENRDKGGTGFINY